MPSAENQQGKYLLTNFGFDTTENEPLTNVRDFTVFGFGGYPVTDIASVTLGQLPHLKVFRHRDRHPLRRE